MRHIVQVVSGKGGVGKSTIAVNLAVALAKQGVKVALIDADFYGPAIPTLLGGGEIKIGNQREILPAEKYGIKYVSIGFFLSHSDNPVVWRGALFHKVLTQFFHDVAWGEIDICIVDMPPGTGDAQLTLKQTARVSGSLVVTTPQEVALSDVRKAISMLKKVKTEVVGIVENMAGFQAPDGTVYDIFGAGGGSQMAVTFGIPLLASIPIDISLRKGGDRGRPVAFDGTEMAAQVFSELALKLMAILDKKQKPFQPDNTAEVKE